MKNNIKHILTQLMICLIFAVIYSFTLKQYMHGPSFIYGILLAFVLDVSNHDFKYKNKEGNQGEK